ncbi:MAG: methyltransferase domain-containing protein, partial [Bacteriovorax sp.]
ALDFSSEAIKRAPQSKIDYKNSSVVDAIFFQDSSYDLVFDSHCLNCLTDEKERSAAYENIFKSLKKKALFASELMVQPIGKNISLPFKAIKTSIELEQEVLSHGFKIIYFMIVRGSTFTSEVDGVEIECDVLRLIAQK